MLKHTRIYIYICIYIYTQLYTHINSVLDGSDGFSSSIATRMPPIGPYFFRRLNQPLETILKVSMKHYFWGVESWHMLKSFNPYLWRQWGHIPSCGKMSNTMGTYPCVHSNLTVSKWVKTMWNAPVIWLKQITSSKKTVLKWFAHIHIICNIHMHVLCI